jgi:hypothetical protein
MGNTTTYHEKDMYEGDMWWECQYCSRTASFDGHKPWECEFNYCPGCGREILEFVEYREEGEE